MHMSSPLALAIAGLLAAPNLVAAEVANGPDSIARGLMMFHQGRMIFSPCRERSYVEIDDVSPDHAVSAALRGLGLAADKPLYAELFGKAEHGTLRAEGINFASIEARCPAPPRHTGRRWQAEGRNPAWHMSATDDMLRLQQEGRPAIEGRFAENGNDPLVTRLQAKPGAGPQWALRRQLCYGPDGRFVSGWSAEADSPGTTLSGCAWKP